MARYVLLRIPDDQEADDLLLDWHENPGHPLLTPTQENVVHFDVVRGLTDTEWVLYSEAGFPVDIALLHEIRDSYVRAGDLAVERDTGSVCAGESTTLGPEGAGDPASPTEKVAEREADR